MKGERKGDDEMRAPKRRSERQISIHIYVPYLLIYFPSQV